MTKAGVTTSYTYNTDGTVATDTRAVNGRSHHPELHLHQRQPDRHNEGGVTMDPVTLGMANANARKTYAPRRHSTLVAIGDSITAPGGTGNGEWPSFVEHLTLLSNQAVKLIYNAGFPRRPPRRSPPDSSQT